MPPQSSRPPRAAVRAAVRLAMADLEPGARVLVALSGGADSLALTAAAVRVCAESGLVCTAAVVDHRLQPESAAVAQRAAAAARLLGCAEVEVLTVSVAAGPGQGGPEAAAREARYAALTEAATRPGIPPAAAVLLGHTRDDQAESVLLGLARGSGTRSLAGMPARSDRFRRPLLDLPRAVVVAAADEEAAGDPRLTPWSDPHNADPTYTRVRVRTTVMPALVAALGPSVVDALARTAGLARADADALDGWAQAVLTGLDRAAVGEPATDRLPIDGLRQDAPDPLPPAVVSRVVRRFLVRAGCPADALTAAHVRAVVALIDAPVARAEVALPGARRTRRVGAALVVRT